jgi:phosphate transport system ATP-binding protein
MTTTMKTMFHSDINQSGSDAGLSAQATDAAVVNALEIKNLNFFYGNFQGLKNMNLAILVRNVTAFIGPSGCGNSSVLRT